MEGYIHNIETMGLVDGPGIRTVIFFQGCALRCAYCHNPDSWKLNEGRKYTSEELVKKVLRYKPYYESSGGGVTISGGDPLMQKEFLLDLLKKLKNEGIHVALDTAGHGDKDYDEILKLVDLVILDIKEIDDKKYLDLTLGKRSDHKFFLKKVEEKKVPLWIRHVVVPGLTESEEHIRALGEEIKKIKGVVKVELLPYHSMGKEKYEKLRIKYPLEGTKDMDRQRCRELEEILKNLLLKNTILNYKESKLKPIVE